MKISHIILAVLIAPTIPSVARADPDDDEEGLKSQSETAIVVTARRLDVARANVEPDLGASTYLLTNDTVENRPGGETTNLGRILLQVPGVSQAGMGRVAVRGSRNGIQYRINNVIIPQGVADFGERLSTRLADRTQLITGALPAQYGLQVGGVVNITTKSGTYAGGGQAELYGGSRHEFEPAFEVLGSSGTTSIFASGSYRHSDVGLSSVDGAADPGHDRTRQIEGFAFIDHLIDEDTRLALIAGTSNERFQLPELPGASRNAVLTGEKREGSNYAIVSYLHANGGATLQVSLFGLLSRNQLHSDEADSLRYEGIARALEQRRTSLGGQIEGVIELGRINTLRGGLVVSNERENVNNRIVRPSSVVSQHIREQRTTSSAFLQDEFRPIAQLTFNVGIRADHVRGTGDGVRFSPRLNLVWAGPGGTTLHAGYARYYVPSPQDTAFGTAVPRLPGETDNYFDIGAERKFGDLTIGFDGYWREVRNLIEERELGSSRIGQAYSISKSRLRGIELSATYSEGPVAVWANGALTKATGRGFMLPLDHFSPAQANIVASEELPLDQDQRLTMSGGASFRIGNLRLAGDIIYGSGGRRTDEGGAPNGARLPAYAQVDFATVYHIDGLGHRPADLRFDVTNLFDRRYEIRDGTALGGGLPEWGPRRGFFVGIEQGF